VPTFGIIEALDVIEYVSLGLITRPIGLARCALGLERGEEALHRCIVPDIACTALLAPGAVQLLLFTDCRLFEVLSPQWEQVDFEGGTWPNAPVYAWRRTYVGLPQRDPYSAVEYNIETPAQKSMAFRDFPKWLEAWGAIEVGPKAPARKEYHFFCLLTGTRPGEAARIRWRDVKPALRVVEIPGAKASNTIQIVMSAPIARALKEARDLGKPKNRDAFVFAHCGQVGQREGFTGSGPCP
jgi:hypothetical protein